MTLSDTTVRWRGLTMRGTRDAAPFVISSIEGWEGLPSSRSEMVDRPRSHGAFDAPVFSGARRVIVSGFCHAGQSRDALLAELGATLTFGDALETLTVGHLGRVLSADARLLRFAPTYDGWATGRFGWAVEWVCPDPLRYGDHVTSAAGFPEQRGGLEYDLYTDGAGVDLGYLEYGDLGSTGTVSLTNEGTADTWPQFDVAGPVAAEGFEIVRVGSGERLVFAGAVPEGSSLVLDSASGVVVIDGTADRAGLLTERGWSPVRPGETAQFVFLPRGARTDAVLTASLRPAFW